jgi:hypothetical protein
MEGPKVVCHMHLQPMRCCAKHLAFDGEAVLADAVVFSEMQTSEHTYRIKATACRSLHCDVCLQLVGRWARLQ